MIIIIFMLYCHCIIRLLLLKKKKRERKTCGVEDMTNYYNVQCHNSKCDRETIRYNYVEKYVVDIEI